MNTWRREHAGFALILAGYLLVGALYAVYTPAWQAPDEPAHYNAIRQVAQHGCCPLIESGDWDSAYLQQLTSAKFAPEHLDRLSTVQYEDHQPPLYSLLAAVVYRLGAGAMLPLRLFSMLLGAGVVALSYAITRCALPGAPHMTLLVMALVAFLPQHMSMLAAVNNDALAELLVALSLLWILRYLDGQPAPVWQLGLLVGCAFLTKLTVYFLAALAALALWLHWRGSGRPASELARRLAVFALTAGLLGGLWWLRNAGVYGWPDVLGLGAHDAVVADQLRSADYIAEQGAGAYLQNMLGTFFRSFIGQFGWMALPLDGILGGWLYRGFGLLMLAGALGAWQGARRIKPPVLMVMLAGLALVALQTAYYNLEFVQWQGRYFFPALIPLALLLVCGLDRWLGRWLQQRWILLAALGLAALDVYLLFGVIVPGLSPG